MALMVPNTEAIAARHENSGSEIMIAINRFDILIPPKDPSRGLWFFLPNKQTGSAFRQKICKEVEAQPDQWAALGHSFSREHAQMDERENSVIRSLL